MHSASAEKLEILALRRRVEELEALLTDLTRAGSSETGTPKGVNLLDLVSDACIAIDSQSRVTFINRSAERMLKRTAADLLGRVIWEELPEFLGTATETQWQRVATGRKPGTSEEHIPQLGRWLQGRYLPLPDGGTSAIFTDVTPQREAEEALHRSQERLHLAQKSARIGTWWLDLQDPGKNVWSAETYDQAGLPHSWQPNYAEWLERVHPEDRKSVDSALTSALNGTAETLAATYRLIRPDGVERWHEARGAIRRKDDGTPVGAAGITVDITDRRESENALRSAEERWRALANALPQFVWVADSYGVAEFINQYFFEYTGLPLGSLSLEDWAKVLHPDDLPGIAAMWERAGATGEEQRFEYRVRRASDGAWRWHLGFHRPVRAGNSSVLTWVGTGFDIHDHRETEESLRTLEESQRLAIDAGEIGLWFWDIRNDSITWTDRIYGFHGVPPGKFGGTVAEFAALVHPDDFERTRDAIRAAVEEDKPYDIVFRTVRPSGEIRWLSTKAQVVRDEAGSPVRMIGAVMDVTADVHAREQLQAKSEQLRLLFEHAPEALLVADETGRFTEVNSAACELLGYTREELTGLRVQDVIPLLDRDRHPLAWARLNRSVSHHAEWDVRHKSGATIPVEISANRLPDGRWQAFIRDIRERRRLHEATVRLAAIVESSDDAIISNDLEGRILTWNAGAEKMFGYKAEEVIGQDLQILAPPEPNDLMIIVERIRAGERIDHYETIRRTKDGRTLVVSLTVSPIRDAAGRIVGASKIARDISESKRAEEELRRNEEQLRFVLDHAPAFIAYIGTDHRYIRVNKAYEDWFGLPASEIVGKHLREAFGEDYFRTVEPMLNRVRQGETVSLDIDAERPGGGIHDFWIVYTPDRDAQGRVQGFIALAHDVTERNRQQRAIRERDIERERLLAALPDIICRFGPDLRFTYISPAVERFTGQAPEFFVGRTHEEAGLPPDLSQELRASLRKVFETGEPDRVEFQFESPVLGSRTLTGYAIGERDESGALRSVMSIVRDITDQRRAEEDREVLLRAEKDARATAELLNQVGPTLVAELDSHRLVQSVTDIATRLVGAEFGSLFHNVIGDSGESYLLYTLSGVPKEAFEAFPMPRNTEVFAPTFRGERVVRSDDITKDPRYGKMAPHHGMPKGHLPVRSYLAAPVVARSGEVLGGLFFGHSAPGKFTEQHEALLTGLAAQASIALDNARLFERSQHIQNELRRSNEELRRANKDLETFAYSASHDLQEPLRMVNISAQLLERRAGDLPAESRQFLKNVQEGAHRMKTLMEDLLSYTRAIRHSDTGAVSPVDAEAVFSRVLENLKSSLEESGAVITHSPLPRIRIIEVHLTQVLQNLLSNALKYRRAEAPRVNVSAVERDGFVTFSVADNGIGIDPRFRDQIFGLFKRLHTRDEYPGSGVGLAICHRIVEQYGGRIWVESNPSGGSVFHFSVPAA